MPTPIQIITTADGSPTAMLPGASETMHSIDGAFQETLHVYERTALWVFDHGWPPRFLSVGLGLGYVEMMFAALYLKRRGDIIGLLTCESFESESTLRESFIAWVRRQPNALDPIYAHIADKMGASFQVTPAAIRGELAHWEDQGRWHLRGELGPQTRPTPASAICFDAFSYRTTPALWEESFLVSFLEAASGTRCVFSSYASLSRLKRALRKTGYRSMSLPGFGRKRESTFAVREPSAAK